MALKAAENILSLSKNGFSLQNQKQEYGTWRCASFWLGEIEASWAVHGMIFKYGWHQVVYILAIVSIALFLSHFVGFHTVEYVSIV